MLVQQSFMCCDLLSRGVSDIVSAMQVTPPQHEQQPVMVQMDIHTLMQQMQRYLGVKAGEKGVTLQLEKIDDKLKVNAHTAQGSTHVYQSKGWSFRIEFPLIESVGLVRVVSSGLYVQ